jgi:UDP-glucose 4-epimerase
MRALVTGGAGFIGSHVARAYVEAGHEVVVMDDLSSGHRENVPAGARFVQADIRTPAAAAAVSEFRPELINHHAAQMNVRVSVDDPRFDADVNVLGLINLVEAGRKSGLERVVFASSGGTVYGEPESLPCTERHPTKPVCPYGVSKLTGEHYLYYYRQIHGVEYVALRYANVYGPLQDPHGEAGVIAIFSTNLLAGRNVTIFGDGLQTRDYVFVADVVRANLAAATGAHQGAVNIGTGRETNVVDLCRRIQASVGGSGTAVHGPAKDGEVRRSVLDVSLAEQSLGWSPRVSLDEGLATTVDFFRSRP